jgi:hypothetical protein
MTRNFARKLLIATIASLPGFGASFMPLPAQGTITLGSGLGPVAPIAPPMQLEITLGSPDLHPGPPSPDWAAQPIRIAVLDFAYVTPDGKVAKDNDPNRKANTGTAVADLLAEELALDPRFQVVRMDFSEINYHDVSTAVLTGRASQVDAVLVGELVETGNAPAKTLVRFTGNAPMPALRFRAGLIDARTGDLLLQLETEGCGVGQCPRPGTKIDANDLNSLALSPIGRSTQQLIAPLEGDGGAAQQGASAGQVTAIDGANVTVKLNASSTVKAGDELTIFAFGLTKDLVTGSLKEAHGLEAGRIAVTQVDGSSATGAFKGDLRPAIGDTVSLSAAH